MRKKRKQLILFAKHFFDAVKNSAPTSKNYHPLVHGTFQYKPQDIQGKLETGNKKISIITDSSDRETNLGQMIQRFTRSFTQDVEVIDLNDIHIMGGCLGCIQCGYDNSCAYDEKDGYTTFFNTKVKNADIIVFAGSIRDRYLSSRWKLFLDRSFFHNHKPVMANKQIGFIISGPLRQIPNLKQAMKGFYEVQQASVVDFITDECGDSATIDALLQNLADRLVRYTDEEYAKPAGFLGVGGKKIFRDNIYGRLRFPFIADHKSYTKNGLYNFPQKKYTSRMINSLMILMCKIPQIREEIYVRRMKTEMIKPLQKVVEKN